GELSVAGRIYRLHLGRIARLVGVRRAGFRADHCRRSDDRRGLPMGGATQADRPPRYRGSPMTITIRPAAPGDVALILDMVRALAVYEREPDAVRATEQSLGETLFGADPRVFVHIAERDGQPLGIALWFLTYSTWTGRPSLYLEDLFVA